MPRPKSEITGKEIHIKARVTKTHREEFNRIGGAAWLRKYLAKSIEDRRNAEKV